MFEWLKTGLLKRNYEKDRVSCLIKKIKLDEPEINWIYIQIADQFSHEDISFLKKALGVYDDPYLMELSQKILTYKKKEQKNVSQSSVS